MGRGWEKAPDVERGGYNVWARNIKAMGDEVMQLLSQGDDYDAGAQLAAVAGGRGICLDILRKIGDLSNTSRDQSAHTSTCLSLDVRKIFSLISRVDCACRQMEQFDAFSNGVRRCLVR